MFVGTFFTILSGEAWCCGNIAARATEGSATRFRGIYHFLITHACRLMTLACRIRLGWRLRGANAQDCQTETSTRLTVCARPRRCARCSMSWRKVQFAQELLVQALDQALRRGAVTRR
jgi:hypothetical protein